MVIDYFTAVPSTFLPNALHILPWSIYFKFVLYNCTVQLYSTVQLYNFHCSAEIMWLGIVVVRESD